jgi:N-acetylglucosaminyl-diphospho-decaprenol L-rhamnosyltransferase
MSLHVVVINFRTPKYTIDCLASLEPEVRSLPGTVVHLVDNASGDDSLPRIREAISARGWSGWVHLMAEEKNLGFAGGNNVALRRILAMENPPRYVLLLNSDTVVHPGCLAACLAAMEADPGVGMLGCLLLNADGTMQNAARKFPTPLRETVRALGLPWIAPKAFGWADIDDPAWDRTATTRDVEWICGAFMFLRTDALRQAGMLSEEFFFYGEDLEFCHRFHRTGWRIRHDPRGVVTHFGGVSSDDARLAATLRNSLTWSAWFKVQRLCYGRLAAAWLRAVYVLAFGARSLRLKWTGQADSEKYRRYREQFDMLRGSLDGSGK